MVEEVDCLLQRLERRFLPLAIARDVGHGPRRDAREAALGAERTSTQAKPARRAIRRFGRHADFFHMRTAGAHRLHVVGMLGPGQFQIGAVRIDHAAGSVGDGNAIAARVGQRLGQVVAAGAAGEFHDAVSVSEQREHACDRKARQHGDDVRLRLLAPQEKERDRRADQRNSHEQDQPGASRRLRAVHARQFFVLFRPGHGQAFRYSVRPDNPRVPHDQFR